MDNQKLVNGIREFSRIIITSCNYQYSSISGKFFRLNTENSLEVYKICKDNGFLRPHEFIIEYSDVFKLFGITTDTVRVYYKDILIGFSHIK